MKITGGKRIDLTHYKEQILSVFSDKLTIKSFYVMFYSKLRMSIKVSHTPPSTVEVEKQSHRQLLSGGTLGVRESSEWSDNHWPSLFLLVSVFEGRVSVGPAGGGFLPGVGP